MGVVYAEPTDPNRLDPIELSERIEETVRTAVPWLVTLSDAQAAQPEHEGKWSAKQVIGHLADSAVNNLGRILRMQIGPERLPGYDQETWVDLQHYSQRDWAQVLALWFALNEHLVWTVRHIERHSLANQSAVAGEVISLGFLIEDYAAHMRHHLQAMKLWVPAAKD